MSFGKIAYLSVFISLLLLVPTVSSSDAHLFDNANYTIKESHLIDVDSGDADNISLSFSLPLGSVLVDSSHPFEEYIDEEFNQYSRLEVKRPELPIRYFYTYNLSVSEQTTDDLEDVYVLSDHEKKEMKKYLDQNDTDILRPIAQNITKNTKTDFEKISRLAIWVNQNIAYDLDAIHNPKDPLFILDSRKGVCSDLSSLFVSLCRSIGYPARYVNGFAYSSEDSSWVAHSWAEVYLGKWVPADPTWLEVGRLDAAHVSFKKTAEPSASLASISAYLYPPGARLIWSGDRRSNDADRIMSIDSYSLADHAQDYDFGISSTKLPGGAKSLFYIGFQGKDHRLIKTDLLGCKSDDEELFSIDMEKRFLITDPKRTQYLIWEANTSPDLSQDMVYNCPVLFDSDHFGSHARNIQITDNVVFWPKIDARAQSNPVQMGKMQKIFSLSENKLINKSFGLITDSFRLDTNSSDDGVAIFSFVQKDPSSQTVYIYPESGDYRKIDYDVTQKDTDTSLGVIQPVYANELSKVIFTINQIGVLDGDKSYTLRLKEPASDWSYELNYPFVGNYSFDAIFENVSYQYLTIQILDGEKVVYEQNQIADILSRADAWVEDVKVYNHKINITVLDVTVRAEGPIKNIYLIIDGHAYPIKIGTSRFEIPRGEYNAKIGWTDHFGTYDEKGFKIRDVGPDDPIYTGPSQELTSQSTLYSSILFASVVILILVVVLEFLHKTSDR